MHFGEEWESHRACHRGRRGRRGHLRQGLVLLEVVCRACRGNMLCRELALLFLVFWMLLVASWIVIAIYDRVMLDTGNTGSQKLGV